jgi:hypothetical protein
MADPPRPDSFRQTLADALGTADLRRIQTAWALTSFALWAYSVILAVYAYEQRALPPSPWRRSCGWCLRAWRRPSPAL